MKKMNINVWILLYACGWLNGVICIHATCNSMGGLTQTKTNITCKSDEVIYVNEQSINFLGSDAQESVINNNECKNSTSSKCFRTLAKDFSSYLNISTSCNDKNQIIVRKTIFETRNGSLYLRSNETGRCLIRGSIESARILEQVNMRFSVSGRKSRLCTELLTSGSFIYDEDLSCLVGVNDFYLEIQITKTRPRKLWMEFKGISLKLECGDNIQLPNESESHDGSTIFPIIMGLVPGLLLLLALIILKRRKALTTRTETKHCTMTAGTTLDGEQDCTYYKFQDDVKDIQEISSSFDGFIYCMSNNDANYEEINIKNNTSDSDRINGEQNVKKGKDDTEGSREESRDSIKVTPVSSKTAENKLNSFIGGVTDNIYATVRKTSDLISIDTEEGDIYSEVSTSENVK